MKHTHSILATGSLWWTPTKQAGESIHRGGEGVGGLQAPAINKCRIHSLYDNFIITTGLTMIVNDGELARCQEIPQETLQRQIPSE